MRLIIALTAACTLTILSCGVALAWPSASDWTPLLVGGAPKQDALNDATTYKNLVSDATHSTIYTSNDGIYMYFRLRLDGDPAGSGGQGALKPAGWGVEFDTDSNALDYEWMLLVDGKSSPEIIGFWENTVKSGTGDPNDKPETLSLSTDVSNMRVLAADTSLNGDQDYFLDFRINYATFKAITGLTDSSPIRVFEGSSSSADGLQESGADFSGGYSDFFTPDGINLTTGSVAFVSDIAGNGDATQVQPGDPLYIRVDDTDMNNSTSTVQTITVTVTSPLGESETVTLTETGPNTGIFTGTLATAAGAAAGPNNNGTITAADTNVLTVTYLDNADNTGIPIARTDTITVVAVPLGYDGTIDVPATFGVGSVINITVSDPDLNTNAAAVETVTITAVNLATGESESIICTETGINTGIFTATLPTAFGVAAGANNSGSMNVQAGDTIRATYNDTTDISGNPAVRTDDTIASGGIDGIISTSVSVITGAEISIAVTDADLNTNILTAETVTVTLVNLATGESETVTCVENGANTGVFTATLPTAFGVAAGANNSGSMNVQAGNTVRATYIDALTAAGGTATDTDDTTILGGTNGTITTTASIIPGASITVTVTDADLNTDALVIETVTVFATNLTTGEIEWVSCSETGINTGIFTATLPTAFGTTTNGNNSGSMNVQAGNTVRATYNDAMISTGGTATVTDDTAVTGGVNGTISTTTSIIPGASIAVTVTDADLNANALAAETIAVTLVNLATGESESVTCTETGVNMGVFTANLATAFGATAGANNSGSMNAQAGDTVRATYNDTLTSTGGTATATDDTSVTGGGSGTIVTSTSIVPGASIAVTVTDADLNANAAAAETITVTLVNLATGESESVTCTETGVNTGVFTASLVTVFGTAAGANNSGSMNVQAGNTVRGTYNDAFAASGGTATLTDDTTVTGGHDSAITATASVPVGTSITITVTDIDLNANAVAVETVAITAINATTGESESVTCTETGVNTGVFTGTLPTAYGAAAGANNSGSMNVQSGVSITSTYNDTFTSTGGTQTLSATTAITGGTDGTITSTTPVSPGSPIAVTITDADLNKNPLSIETVTATGINSVTGETETITLTETGVSTGVFQATAPTAYAPGSGAAGDGAFNAINGHTINFTYADTFGASGGSRTATSATAVVDTVNFVTIVNPSGAYNIATHDVRGATDPFSTVTMTHPKTGASLTATADSSGNYTIPSVEFPEGITTFAVTSVNLSGKTASAAATVDIDTLNTLTLTTPQDASVINQLKTDIEGATDPGSTVTLIEPATGNTLTTTANFSGVFTFPDVDLLTGANTLQFVSTDPRGNIASLTAHIFVDPDIALSITSIISGKWYNYSSHQIAGITDPAAAVATTSPAGTPLAATAGAAGAYSFGSYTFAEGANTVNVSATDAAGNFATAAVTFYVDTLNTDTIITTGTFTVSTIDITGTTDPLSTVTMTHPVTGEIYKAVAAANGTYIFTAVPFPDGTYTLSTTSTDPHGNTASDTSPILVDTTVKIVTNIPPSGSINPTNTADISGNTDPFATVTTADPVTGATLTTTADANGDFAFPGVNLNPGNNPMTFTAVDPPGNTASTTYVIFYNPGLSFTVDSIPDGSIISGTTHDISGTATPGSIITIIEPHTGNTLTQTADGSGNYTFEDVTFDEGVNTITITVTDPLTNTATINITVTVRVYGVDAVLTASARVVFGNRLMIQVSDAEAYLDPSARETITVTISNPTTGDSETATLLETGPNTGVFTGGINTVERSTSDGANSGTLAVLYGNTVTTTYIDHNRSDGSQDVPVTADTLITNDEIKINVRASDYKGGLEVVPLSSTKVAILEVDSSGGFTGGISNYTTDANGYIPASFVGKMKRGYSYRILVVETFRGVPYSQSSDMNVDMIEPIQPDSRGVKMLVIVLDPAGYVYDAMTGDRVDGADVTLYHENGTPVAGPFAFFTQRPSITESNPQLSGGSGVEGGFEFIGSSLGSDITAGNYYITVTFDANPALAATYREVTKKDGTWSGVQQPYSGQVFRVDVDNQPIGIRIPLSRSLANTTISVEKTADKDSAVAGGIITYTIIVRNLGAAETDANFPVVVADMIPIGLTVINASAYYENGTKVESFRNGKEISFVIGRLQPAGDPDGNDIVKFFYQATVDTAAQPGMYLTNTAVAEIDSYAVSNTAAATVRVDPDPLMDMATLVGKVFRDEDGDSEQDENEAGVAGIGIALDTGAYATTDKYGKYSIPGIYIDPDEPGYRVVKLDTRTLEPGVAPLSDTSVQIKLSPGGISKANFTVASVSDTQHTVKRGQSLFVLSLDGAAGEIKSGAGEDNRPNKDTLPEGGAGIGRAAFLFDGSLGRDIKLTASYDSAKKYSFDLDPSKDRDLAYPTFGDDSSLKYLTNSQGKLYVNARGNRASLLFGNFSPDLGGGLSGVKRQLYGGRITLNMPGTETGMPTNDSLLLFGAGNKQLHARTELRSNGGTIYYLAHSDIAAGSESVTVEIRDSFIPEKVLAATTLENGIDYEIDYLTGRLVLSRPMAANSHDDPRYSAGADSGDPVWIVVEYVYSPVHSDLGIFGAKWSRTIGDEVGFGASYLRENTEGQDHLLRSADFRLKGIGHDILSMEIARSTAGGEPWLASLDGGRSFIDIATSGSDSKSAFKGNFNLKFVNGVDMTSYYYAVDSGFSGSGWSERGIKRGGLGLSLKDNNSEWRADYTRAASLASASAASLLSTEAGRTRSARLSYKNTTADGSFKVELAHKYNANGSTLLNVDDGTENTLFARYEKKINDRTKLYISRQDAFNAAKNYINSLGANYKMRAGTDFTAELNHRSRGTGGRFGFEKSLKDGGKAYISAGTTTTDSGGGRGFGATAGANARLGKNTTAFAEYSSSSDDEESVLSRTVGINRKYYAGGGMSVSLSAERSEERSSLSGNYFTNSGSAGFDLAAKNGKLRAASEAVYRRNSGSISKDHFSFSFNADRKASDGMTLFYEYEYSASEDLQTSITEEKYTKFLFGAAFRPNFSDKLNFISKIGRTREFRAPSENRTVNPDEKATVLSLEGLYMFEPNITLREKIASRFVREQVSPLPEAKTHTILWITGLEWKFLDRWDAGFEYRTRHQPTNLNHKDGFSLETGRTIKNMARAGFGYNFSAYSDDEFASNSYSFRGVFFRLQMKK